MALVHYLYVGHFIPEKGYVRFQGHLPAVTRPIETSEVNRLLRNYLGDTATIGELPEHWAMSIVPDYIVCNQHGAPPPALRFLADYAQQAGAIIIDMGSFSLLTPEQVRQSASELLQARPA